MSDTAIDDGRDDKGRFVTGAKPGPGRPAGSRAKLADAYIRAMCEDFLEHGPAVIAKVRIEQPGLWLKLQSEFLPKDVNLNIGIDAFVIRAPMVAATSEAWAAAVASPAASSAEIIDLKPVEPSKD